MSRWTVSNPGDAGRVLRLLRAQEEDMSIDTLIGAASTQTERELFAFDDIGAETIDPAWRIEDLKSADWALARLAECDGEAADLDVQAEAAIKRIRERVDALKMKAARGSSFFRFKLAEYAERERATLLHGKKKTRELLHGKFAWKAKPERLEVTDRAALEAWLALQPVERGLWRQTIAPEMKALQDLFKRTGEIPPGCEVKAAEDTLTIEAIAPERALEE